MTASVNIKRGDLHLALSTAFNRGRYVLMTGGDGQPQEITIDLRERPDDLFESESGIDASGSLWRMKPDVATDDHGPAIPAQAAEYVPPERGVHNGGWTFKPVAVPSTAHVWTGVDLATGPDVLVYEFALQDCKDGAPASLEMVTRYDAPDSDAFLAADWVHVYDRVTRERRTLKRPAPDAVLTGLRDVAADLRGKPVEPPFGCAALPPVGPLTSVEGLKVGDIMRVLEYWPGHIAPIKKIDNADAWPVMLTSAEGSDGIFPVSALAFVGRPEADGWMTNTGFNPGVDGVHIQIDVPLSPTGLCGDGWPIWGYHDDSPAFPRFRIVDTPPAV